MKYIFLCCVILQLIPCVAQDVRKEDYDIHKLRFLVHMCGSYIHAVNQGTLDLDSAMVLACDGQQLPITLYYDEGYNDGSPLPGSMFMARGDIKGAETYLQTLKGGDRIKLLLQLASFYIFKSGNRREHLSMAVSYINSCQELVDGPEMGYWQSQVWIIKGRYFFQEGDIERGKECFERAIALNRRSGDGASLAMALNHFGAVLPLRDSAKEHALNESRSIYAKLNNKEKEAEVLTRIIGIHFWQNNFALARAALLENLEQQRVMGFRHRQYTETTIAFVSTYQGDQDEALHYALESIESMDVTQDTAFSGYFFHRLGSIYISLHRYDEALAVFESLFERNQSDLQIRLNYTAYLAAASVLEQKGKYEEMYKFLLRLERESPPSNMLDRMYLMRSLAAASSGRKQDDEAEGYYVKMLDALQRLSSVEVERDAANAYAAVANFYARKGDVVKSHFFLTKAEKYVNPTLVTSRLIEFVRYRLDSLSGNYFSALYHFQTYKQHDDTIFFNVKNEEVEGLRVRYETAKKEQNIKALENQSQIQKMEVERSAFQRNAIAFGLLISCICIGLVYNRYRIRTQTNRELKQLVKEKERLIEDKDWLIKEIHHRVKNNLQIVISLMNIQSRYLETGPALSAIRESQSRMNAMSLIHQKLYQSPSLVFINMETYIRELAGVILKNFCQDSRIHLTIDVSSTELDVSQAVPLGLIINEAVTNAVKYAFPNDTTGQLHIGLHEAENNSCILTIADNGVGLPEGFDHRNNGSIGMTLIHTLVKQLDGIVLIRNQNGLVIKIDFIKGSIDDVLNS